MKAYFKCILLIISFLGFWLLNGVSQNLEVIFHKDDATCASNGSAQVQITSSCTGNYHITWHSGSISGAVIGSNVNNILNLAPGQYTVEVTDAPCTPYINTFEIEESEITASITQTGNLCAGNAILTANINGLSASSYLWSTSQTTASIAAPTAGAYSVTVTMGSCTAEAYTNIALDDFFSISYNPYLCENMNSSAIVSFPPGEVSFNYSFFWSTGSIYQSITINTSGTYSVTVTHLNNGCVGVKEISVSDAPTISLYTTPINISCFGMVDGYITAFPSDAAGSTFTYQWSNSETTQTIQNLPTGDYSVTVISSIFGCKKVATTFIDEPDPLSFTVTPQDTGFCKGASATLRVYPVGGTSPYHYFWNDLQPNPMTENFRNISPLSTTSYTVSVVDSKGCTTIPKNINIVVSQPIILNPVTTNESCYGSCNGQCILQIQGGIAPFDYSWPNLTNVWNNLCADDYSVSVVDKFGCSASTQFVITKPDTLVLAILSGNATCFGYNDGFVQVFAFGGVPFPNGTYKYLWNNGATVDSLAATAGYYNVKVTDANGCFQTASTVVTQPEQIYLVQPYNKTICRGEFYHFEMSATGGVGPYDFTWQGSDNSTWYGDNFTVYPIQTTEYTVSAVDINGCHSMSRHFKITVNPNLTITKLKASETKVCIGDKVSISIDVSGGNGGPYNFYDKSNNIINSPYYFKPQETGYYKYKVTDDCGTPAVWDSVFITVFPLPNVAFYADRLNSCPDEKFFFTEISQDNKQTYLWDFGDGGKSFLKNPSYAYTSAGLYTVILNVIDTNGCKNQFKMEDKIEIYPYPIADFSSSPDIITIVNPYVTFENLTIGASSYFWDFGDGEDSYWNNGTRQFHTYKDIGDYEVTLIAVAEHPEQKCYCYDTIHKKIVVRDKHTFYAPTIFTPDGNGKNDYFYIVGSGISRYDFELVILDRWGEIVYRIEEYNAEDPKSTGWDGTNGKDFVKKGAKALPNGIYTWRCKYIDINGKKHEESGQVLLAR